MRKLLYSLCVVSFMFFAHFSVANELEDLKTHTQTVHKEITDLKSSGGIVSSTLSRNMLIHQLESMTSESSSAILTYARSEDALENKEETIALISSQKQLITRQQKEAEKILREMFKNFEEADSSEQPIQWLTVSNAIDYRSELLSLELEMLKAQEALGAKTGNSLNDFNRRLKRIASDMYIFLESSLKQFELIKSERGNIPSDQRTAIDTRLRMQQRMNRTFSENLKSLVPLLSQAGIDTGPYNELAFSATGELSDAITSSDAFVAVGHGLLEKLTHWVTENAGSAVSKFLVFVLIIFFFRYLSGLVKSLIERIVRAPQSKLSTLVQDFTISMSGKAVMLLGILIALGQVGLNLGPLLTGLGVAGIVIGFALQDTLSNFASGMMILIYRPFDVNDFVEAGGVSGMVSHMSLVNTTIRTFDNQIFIVPNSQIWSTTIKNITAEKVRRVDMVFGIGYGDDIAKTEAVLLDILTAHEKVLRSPEPVIKVMTLNDSSVDFVVRPWVKTSDYWDVYWDVTREVKLRFDQEGISIPFPQRDVHINQP